MSEEDACEICDSIWSTKKNQILYCDGRDCNMPVHQDCYGIESIPEEDWYCQLCDYKRRRLPWNIICCPSKSGAFKQTTERGEFIHVLCAIWNKNINHKREPYAVKRTLINEMECYFCKKRTGICVKCEHETCTRTFHVVCAVSGGWIDPEASDDPGSVRCKAHMRSAPGRSSEEDAKRKRISTNSFDTQMRDLFGDDSSDEDSAKKEADSAPPLLLPRPPPPSNKSRLEGVKRQRTESTTLPKSSTLQVNPSLLTSSKKHSPESKNLFEPGHQRSLSEQSDKSRSFLMTRPTPNVSKPLYRSDFQDSSRSSATSSARASTPLPDLAGVAKLSPLNFSKTSFLSSPKSSPVTTPRAWIGAETPTFPSPVTVSKTTSSLNFPKDSPPSKSTTTSTPRPFTAKAPKPQTTTANKPHNTDRKESLSSTNYADLVKRKLSKIVDTYFPTAGSPDLADLQEQLDVAQQSNQNLQQELARLRTFHKRATEIFTTLNIEIPGNCSPKDDIDVYVDELRGLLGRTCPLSEQEQADITAGVDHLMSSHRPVPR